MQLKYVPLLQIQRDIQGMPRNMERFKRYIRTLTNEAGDKVELPSLGIMNPMGETEVKSKIQEILDTMINPAVAGHGGFVELLDVKENVVYLRLGGGCQGCGMVNVTLKQGIEMTLKEEIPQIVGVIDQTDHAGGSNPYYQPSK